MRIEPGQIQDLNRSGLQGHKEELSSLKEKLEKKGVQTGKLLDDLAALQVAVPSWALGAGGTRFGRFSFPGEPATLEDKIQDVGIVHYLTRAAGSISLHIPWDIPSDPLAAKEQSASLDLVFDAVNSNTFQDQPGQESSYKFGSLGHMHPQVREQAVEHNKEVIRIGEQLGSKSLTVWLADGSTFPGQHRFRNALHHTKLGLQEIYAAMPSDWAMHIEYKPYEPNFYSMVIPDWGTSLLLAEACGNRAFTLVDLGHHLPNTNIEQIVSTLLYKGKLGGFHFNDSKYGDDDLTVGVIKPFQLFLIFNEIIFGRNHVKNTNPQIAWMIDASHNVKDPLEDLIQSLEAIRIAYAKALLIDQDQLDAAQLSHDVALAQEVLHDACNTDVRPLVREARLRANGAIDPLQVYRRLEIRKKLVEARGADSVASGL